METKNLAIAGGAILVLFLILSATKGSAGTSTLAPVGTASADASQSFAARVGLAGSLANIAGTLDQSQMQLDAAKSHDSTTLSLASLESQYGMAKLQNDFNIAHESYATQVAINDRNARTLDKQSNNDVWGKVIGTATTIASFFLL